MKFEFPKIPSIPSIVPQIAISYQNRLNLYILLSIAAGILTFLSLFDTAGRFGSFVKALLMIGLGKGAFLVLILFIISTVVLIRIQKSKEFGDVFNLRLGWGVFFMCLAFLGTLSLFSGIRVPADIDKFGGGGLVGYFFYPFVLNIFGPIGAFVILLCIFLFGFFLFTQKSFSEILDIGGEVVKNPAKLWDLMPDAFEIWRSISIPKDPIQEMQEDVIIGDHPDLQNMPGTPGISSGPIHMKLSNVQGLPPIPGDEGDDGLPQNMKDHFASVIDKTGQQNLSSDQANNSKLVPSKANKPIANQVSDSSSLFNTLQSFIFTDNKKWELPPLQLLKLNTDSGFYKEDIEGNKRKIHETFRSFGIAVAMSEAITGPTVSQYTFRPASGVKLSKISALQQDLALALAAPSLRMEMPIPGKSAASIEIPNKIKHAVRIRDMVENKEFRYFDQPLPIAVGKSVSGQNIFYSLAKAPHLLVAGATGAGKSVWINSLLISLLYKYSPRDLQLILVDMKMVELNLYDGVPHLLTNVITESDKAINALKWSVFEMDRRYKLLKQFGKRNIRDYNQFTKTHKSENLEQIPYIVFVIDELADLMIQAKSEVEPIIARLTAMSRAVGIHLVLGTQRPDVNVVTGLIKTNIPTRICFAVVTQIDSRVILDSIGGEALLGMGDGLIKSPNTLQAVRFQGANVEESEVKSVVEFTIEQNQQKQGYSNFNPDVTEPPVGSINVPGLKKAKLDMNDGIAVYEKAKELVVDLQQCSVSILTGNLGVDSKTAKKILEELYQNGVIGPEIPGMSSREVLLN